MQPKYRCFYCEVCRRNRRFYPDFERECFEWVCGECRVTLSSMERYAQLEALSPHD